MQYNKIMEKDTREIFAERIKELRLEKGLSHQQLGEELKINGSTISRWENCKIDVRSYQLVKLAKYFSVSIDYLLGVVD